MSGITNWGTAIINALANTLNQVVAFIPRLVGFLLILFIGWIIAALIAKGITYLLRRVGFDRWGERIGLARFEQNMGIRLDSAGVLGKVVFWFIFLIFLVPAVDALGVPAVSNLLYGIIAYLPNVFVAILVLILGALLATFVADLIRGFAGSAHTRNANVLATIARYAVFAFAVLIALEQLNIAPALINELFGGVALALALAFGLAFGLGGRETAQRMLNQTESIVRPMVSDGNASSSLNQSTAPTLAGPAPVQTKTPPLQSDQDQAHPR